MNRTIFVLVCALRIVSSPCFGEPARQNGQDVVFGVKSTLPSPDGVFSATTEGGDIFVTNNKTHKVYDSIEVQPPVSYIMWTSDSRAIVSVEHLAMSDLVAISHYFGDKWVRREVELPPQFKIDKYSLLDLRCKGHKIHVGFGGEHLANGNPSLYRIVFDIDPVTHAYTHLDGRIVSAEEFDNLPKWREH